MFECVRVCVVWLNAHLVKKFWLFVDQPFNVKMRIKSTNVKDG